MRINPKRTTFAEGPVTGVFFIAKEVDESESNEGFNEFSVSATHHPSATVSTASGNTGGASGAEPDIAAVMIRRRETEARLVETG